MDFVPTDSRDWLFRSAVEYTNWRCHPISFCALQLTYPFALSTIINCQQYGFVGISMYSFTIMLIKAAILLEWVRIFVPAGTRNSFYYTCHILLWINVLFYVAIIIAVNLACTPYEQNWNFLLDGHCIRTDRANMASAIINFVFDLIIPILPQRGIWKLHMSRQKKLGVSLVFAIGLMFVSLWASSLNVEYMSINILIPLLFSACLTAGIRVGITIRAVTTTPYTTYSYSQLSLCCLAEMTCGFLVFCIPSAPRAFHTLKDTKMISTLKSWTRSSVEGMKGTRTNGSSMPRSSLKPSIYNRAHEVDERGLIALETLGTGDLIQQQLYTSEQSPSQPAIAPATHFMATEDFSSGSPSEAYLYSQQRPWGQDEGPWEQRR